MDVDILRYLTDLRSEQDQRIEDRFAAFQREMDQTRDDAREARRIADAIERERRDTGHGVVTWVMHVIALLISSVALYLASRSR